MNFIRNRSIGLANRLISKRFYSINSIKRINYKQQQQQQQQQQQYKVTKYGIGITILSIGLFNYFNSQSANISNDSDGLKDKELIYQGVNVDSTVSPFPINIKSNFESGESQLIGYGVRKVSIFQMKVYALGIYLNKDDLKLVKDILNSRYLETIFEQPVSSTAASNEHEHDQLKHKEHLQKAFADDDASMLLAKALVDSGVRFSARIVPVRNTDFNHLRDGLTRSIKNSAEFKSLVRDNLNDEKDRFATGLLELRDCFSTRKGSAKTGTQLLLELNTDNTLNISFQDSDKHVYKMGTVKEPLVGRILFLQYLNKQNPLCREAMQISVDSLSSIAG
ncbi:unnamed protein product [[Candida] boidinii]|nr:unnamed protein product [[Candida] boidinii]